MLIDLPINSQEFSVIDYNAKQQGIATPDYIANLLRMLLPKNEQIQSQETKVQTNKKSSQEITSFYYDIDEMNEAINAPRVKVPDNLSDEEFLTWVKNLNDTDFVEHS